MQLATWRPDFYSAAASIIPVLLISIALQERYFRTLYRLLGGRTVRDGAARGPGDTTGSGRPHLVRRVVAVLASLSFLGGGVAEILALRSLWYGHDYFGWFVFFMIAVLLG